MVYRKTGIINRVLSVLFSLVLIFQSLAPSVALAQEATSSASLTTETSPEPLLENPSPSPTSEPQVSPQPAETLPEEASPAGTPSPSPSSEQPLSDQVDNVSPVEETVGQPNAPPQEAPSGHLSATILENTNAQSLELDLTTQGDTSSASLTTDKGDYAPTDTAVITGSDFPKNTNLNLIITAENYRFETQVTTDENGSFIYSYQLDGTFRPLYTVEAYDLSGTLLATVTFTDTPTKITAKTHEGQEKVGGVLNGYTSGNVTEYSEGDTINFRFKLETTHGPSSGQLEIRYTGDDGTCLFFDGSFTLGTIEAISGSQPTITTSGSPTQEDFGTSNGEWVQVLNINYPGAFGHGDPDSKTRVNYTLKLSNEAGQCNGSSQHSRLDPAGGAVEQGGQQNVPVPANQVIELPEITVTKNIDRDGNGSFESTAAAGEYSFTLDGTTTLLTNASGQVVFTNVTPNGAHTITETQVDFSQGTYAFVSGSGTNCTFTGSTATATVAADTTPTNASCTFNNGLTTGTVIVHKDVQGPNGEAITDTSQNFTVRLDSTNPQSFTDGGTVTYTDIAAGTHTITEDAPPNGYTLFSITPDNDGGTAGAQVTVTAGQTTNVSVVNRQQNATITVTKDVVDPDGNPVSDSHQFTVNVDGQSDQIGEGDNGVFPVVPGTYTITENSDPAYDLVSISPDEDLGTDGTQVVVGPGEQQTVNVVNKQKKATINVVKDVRAPDGSNISDSHAFTTQLNGANNQSFSETLTASYSVNPGSYSITEVEDSNYTYVSCTPDANQTPGDGAQVTISSNGTITVTCTNKQNNAIVTIVKDVRAPNGNDVPDSTNFVVQRDGADNKDFHEGLNAVYTLAPGTYTFSEIVTAGYTLNNINPDNDANVGNGTTATLNSGQNLTITFTNYQNVGSISGFKFEDNDGSLGTTNDRTGLINWAIELWSCASNFAGCVLSQTTNTASDGSYSFSSIVPGYYQVKEFLQNGWTALTAIFKNVTLNPGGNVTEQNFINFKNVSVKACKVIDADGAIGTTGDQTNKSGWTVKLLVDGQVSQVNGTQTTEENGCYTWSDLGPNHTYGVSEIVPSGWTALTPQTHDFGQATSGSNYVFTFVNFQNAQIIVHKNVLGTDGVTDVDDLTEFTALLSGGNPKTIAEDTDATYSNLAPGTYTITEGTPLPPGYTLVSITDTSGNTSDGIVTVTSGGTFHVNVTNTRDAGTIKVIKEVDPADNSQWDITISGPTPNNNTLGDGDSTGELTSATGTYTISETGHTGTNASDYNSSYSCEDATAVVASGSGTTISNLTLSKDQNIVCTFTNSIKRGSISGVKFEDGHGDGIKDISDNGLGSWTINLTGTATDTKTTASLTGSYSFNNLLPGTYQVCEGTKSGWMQTAPLSGYSCSNGTKGYTIELAPGQNVTDIDFGNFALVTIDVEKFHDLNNDNTWDSGEPKLAGWTITLDKDGTSDAPACSGGTIDGQLCKRITDSSGNVSFTDLGPGTYIMREELQGGWLQTRPNASFGGIGAQAGGTYILTASSGADFPERQFGNVQLGKIIVKKTMVGGTDSFEFTGDVSGTISDNEGTLPIDNLVPGTYTSVESEKTDWELTDISCDDGQSATASFGDVNTRTATFELNAGETVTCTFTNTRDTGEIVVNKQVDTNGDGSFEGDNDVANELSFRWGIIDIDEETPERLMGSSKTLDTGTYDVDENSVPGYHFVGWFEGEGTCEDPENTELPASITVEKDQPTEITLCNARDTGSITVIKDVIPDDQSLWDITISGPASSSSTLADGGSLGPENLPTGSYTISEEASSGTDGDIYDSSFSCVGGQEELAGDGRSVDISLTKEGITCTFTNQLIPPTLLLTKTNNRLGSSIGPGGDVIYTLTVTAKGSPMSNVSVTDLLPAGFVYQTGSWTAKSSVRGDLKALGITTEPTYASPGVWQLGNMIVGEVVTLTLLAKTSDNIDLGLYKDLAWAKGTGADESRVLANALSGIFVGTEVNVVRDDQGGKDVSITKEEEVLGASIELPATGANAGWLVLAFVLLLTGVGLVATGITLRRKYD
ncbi:hypothetical protein HY387_01190 [Candidatus Daviesbacteria bacterium]|nr:hypothetical protein [Candidatus Daviesbacteria bacterium]